MAIDTDRLTAKRTKLLTAISAYEDALIAFAGGAQSYTLDTGQTRQTVTRANLTELRRALEALEAALATVEAQLYGRGRAVVVPGF